MSNPERLYYSYPIHKLVFDRTFSEACTGTLRQIYKLFDGTAIIKINQHKDLAIVLPHLYLAVALERENLLRGDIVFPVNNLLDGGKVQIFIPTGCDDEDVGNVSLENLLPCLNPNVLPEERLTEIVVTVKIGDNFVSVKAGHTVNVGDYLVVRGKSYKVTIVTEDDCFTKVERSRNIIFVRRSCNMNKQCLRIRRMICLNGRITSVKKEMLHSYRKFQLVFKANKNGNNHGCMEMEFSNAIFNVNGFYTRCRAIPEEDMV